MDNDRDRVHKNSCMSVPRKREVTASQRGNRVRDYERNGRESSTWLRLLLLYVVRLAFESAAKGKNTAILLRWNE